MSGKNRQVEQFRQRGQAAQQAKVVFYKAFHDGLRDSDPAAYGVLLADYRRLTAAALPPGWPAMLSAIESSGAGAIENGIAFLEADPWFNNSGYAKAEIIRRLKRARLTFEQKERLARIVVDRIMGPDRPEIGAYGKLAAALRLPELDQAVMDLTSHAESGVARRATWVYQRIASRS